MMRKFFGALVVGVPVNVMYKFSRQRLSLSWRQWLTTRVMDVRCYAVCAEMTIPAVAWILNPNIAHAVTTLYRND